MLVSRAWLGKFFDASLPAPEELAHSLTFHSFEVEEVKGDTLDVKVLPDRACYALSHRGIAYELSAALGIPLANDPLRGPAPMLSATDEIAVTVCDDALVPRYIAGIVRGVAVGPSPAWLREALESIGQRSINNVVDATNYVMFHLGQPLHAFDAGKLERRDGKYAITVRKAYEGEAITTLTNESYALPEGTLVIADAGSDAAIGIAGVKGGKAAEVTEATTDIVIESANFDGTQVRRAAQALKLFTEASLRFQNRPSPELAGYGMRAVLELVQQVAGGEAGGVADRYPKPQGPRTAQASLERINSVLGTSYEASDVASALKRLLLPYREEREGFSIDVPFVRGDLLLPEDIAEEAGRILGYDQVPATELPPLPASEQREYLGIERIKDVLLERGYVEISTPSFTAIGDVELANPLQMDRSFLRPDLSGNMRDALTRAKREAPRVLGPEDALKLFEIGTVFARKGEHMALALGYEALEGKASKTLLDEDIDAIREMLPGIPAVPHDGKIAELALPAEALESAGERYEPKRIVLGPYQPYSIYPFALRDIAVWTPEGTEESEIALSIQKEAGELLARIDRFDRFTKDGRTSYAFRLVFQSFERTLADTDLDAAMKRVTASLDARDGWEVR